MAEQRNNDTPWPDLESLNGGNQLTTSTGVTADIFNVIVRALIYLYSKPDKEAKKETKT